MSCSSGVDQPADQSPERDIKVLKAKLINEEHKLILMKKIRLSQTRPQQPQQQQNQNQQSQHSQQPQQSRHHQNQHQHQHGSPALNDAANKIGPIKKVRPSPSSAASNRNDFNNCSKNSSFQADYQVSNNISNSSLVNAASTLNQTPAHAHQRPKAHNLWNPPTQQQRHPTPVGIAPPHVGNLSRQPITTPPNVVQDMRAGQQSLLMARREAIIPPNNKNRPRQQHTTSGSHVMTAQILSQKRSAAKLAIQKQIEQHLLQLPQKTIQLGINFVPNANNIEFVYYVGLEVCVDYLTTSQSSKPLERPLVCSSCGTDFTPSWSWKRSQPVCENCVGSHAKKSMKNSQANRIKSVLSKAIKQEADMDQKIVAEAANVVSSQSGASSSGQRITPQVPATQQHISLLQPSRSNWSPMVNSPPSNMSRFNANHVTSTPNNSAVPAVNPANLFQPNVLASLMQMNSRSPLTNPSSNPNQLAQVAALLMNQLTMNLWNKR